jgi:hypothetical protein
VTLGEGMTPLLALSMTVPLLDPDGEIPVGA